LKIYTNRFFAKLVRRIFSLISRKMPGRITSSRIAVSEPNALDVMFSFQKNIQSKLWDTWFILLCYCLFFQLFWNYYFFAPRNIEIAKKKARDAVRKPSKIVPTLVDIKKSQTGYLDFLFGSEKLVSEVDEDIVEDLAMAR